MKESMESLIHHFKIVTEGYLVPEGEVYVAIESPRGESGCYLVSDGGPKPWRVKFRGPSFAALEATAACSRGALVADLIANVPREIFEPMYTPHPCEVLLNFDPLVTRSLRKVDAIHRSRARFQEGHCRLQPQSAVCTRDERDSICERELVLEER